MTYKPKADLEAAAHAAGPESRRPGVNPDRVRLPLLGQRTRGGTGGVLSEREIRDITSKSVVQDMARHKRIAALVLAGEDATTAEVLAQHDQIFEKHAQQYREEVAPLRAKLLDARDSYKQMAEDDGGNPNNTISQIARERLAEVEAALQTFDEIAELPGVTPEADPRLLGLPAVDRALRSLAKDAESDA